MFASVFQCCLPPHIISINDSSHHTQHISPRCNVLHLPKLAKDLSSRFIVDWVVSHGCSEVKWLVLHVRQDCTIICLPYLAAVFSVNEFLTLQSQYVWCCLNFSFCTCLLSNIHICNNFSEINLMLNFIWDAWPSCGPVASIVITYDEFHWFPFYLKSILVLDFHDLHMCIWQWFKLSLFLSSVFLSFLTFALTVCKFYVRIAQFIFWHVKCKAQIPSVSWNVSFCMLL